MGHLLAPCRPKPNAADLTDDNHRHVNTQLPSAGLATSSSHERQALTRARRAAAVMSLIHSARLNGHDPHAYLRDVPTKSSCGVGGGSVDRCTVVKASCPNASAERTPRDELPGSWGSQSTSTKHEKLILGSKSFACGFPSVHIDW